MSNDNFLQRLDFWYKNATKEKKDFAKDIADLFNECFHRIEELEKKISKIKMIKK